MASRPASRRCTRGSITGGIDPYLWEPIPGVQTLDFRPYRVDLTPFAGVLADGNPHVLGVSVFNADSYFLATANLLVYTRPRPQPGDRRAAQQHPAAAAPTPVVKENIKSDAAGTTFTGTIAVSANRRFAITGYVDTSHGRVQTTLEQSVGFLNTQQFDVSPTRDTQNVQQFTTVDSRVSTRGADGEASRESHASYPLAIDYSFVFNADGSVTQTTSVAQRDVESASAGGPFGLSTLANEVRAHRYAQLRRQRQLPRPLGWPRHADLQRARSRDGLLQPHPHRAGAEAHGGQGRRRLPGPPALACGVWRQRGARRSGAAGMQPLRAPNSSARALARPACNRSPRLA